MTLIVRPGRLVVSRLAAGSEPPAPPADGFWCVTRDSHEVSVVSSPEAAPQGSRREGPWRRLEVAGPLDFALTGILAGLAAPLAEAGLPIFVVSTFDTDHLLVREEDLDGAIRALEATGHRVER